MVLSRPTKTSELTVVLILVGINAFLALLSLFRAAWRPYRLSHFNALPINLFYEPKDQFPIFLWRNIENLRSWKSHFFLSQRFWFIHLFFALSSWKSVIIDKLAWMGLNFDDYSGVQLNRLGRVSPRKSRLLCSTKGVENRIEL